MFGQIIFKISNVITTTFTTYEVKYSSVYSVANEASVYKAVETTSKH